MKQENQHNEIEKINQENQPNKIEKVNQENQSNEIEKVNQENQPNKIEKVNQENQYNEIDKLNQKNQYSEIDKIEQENQRHQFDKIKQEKNVDMEHRIRQSASEILIPEELTPGGVIETLQQMKKKKNFFEIYRSPLVACLCLIIIGGVVLISNLQMKGTFGIVPDKNMSDQVNEEKVVLETSGSLSAKKNEQEVSKSMKKLTVASYQDVYKKAWKEKVVYDSESKEMGNQEQELSLSDSSLEGSDLSDEYSTTNIQELNVDEADVVKTDGKRIYLLTANKNGINVVNTKGSEMELIDSLDVEVGESVQEFYIGDQYLTIITIRESSDLSLDNKDSNIYQVRYRHRVNVYTYPLENGMIGDLKGKVSQDGYYVSSRKIGEHVYLMTEYAPDNANKNDIETYIPKIQEDYISCEDIYIPYHTNANGYIVMSSIDQTQPDTILDSKAVIADTVNFYVSTTGAYFTNQVSGKSGGLDTQVIKFTLEKGNILPTATEKVKGWVNDSFSLNEYQGNLRILTTSNSSNGESNNLYILDKGLKTMSGIENIAPDETIRSARFMGDIGYFVTFKETDPLFSVDLSDPNKPQLLGALKIPGFSKYLHPFGKNQLLGIGVNATESGMVDGVKLSMFDISDAKNVTEKNKLIIEYSVMTSVFENYKDVFFHEDKGLVGFGVLDYNGEKSYHVYSYDDVTGFTEKFNLDFRTYQNVTDVNDSGRGLYIGNTFYMIYGNAIHSYDLDTFQETNSIEL